MRGTPRSRAGTDRGQPTLATRVVVRTPPRTTGRAAASRGSRARRTRTRPPRSPKAVRNTHHANPSAHDTQTGRDRRHPPVRVRRIGRQHERDSAAAAVRGDIPNRRPTAQSSAAFAEPHSTSTEWKARGVSKNARDRASHRLKVSGRCWKVDRSSIRHEVHRAGAPAPLQLVMAEVARHQGERKLQHRRLRAARAAGRGGAGGRGPSEPVQREGRPCSEAGILIAG